MNLANKLQAAGISGKKADIYLALLQLGRGSVIDLAKYSGIKRTTVYNILPDMVREGLVKTGIKRKRHFYFIEDVRQLARRKEDEQKAIVNLLPELRAIHNIFPQKPRITYFEGMGGMKALYQETLDATPEGGIILSYTGLTDFYQLMPYEYYRWYVAERVMKKIRLQVIIPDSVAARDWRDKGREDMREVKLISEKKFAFNADMEIFSNKVALISYRENFMGVIIESKEISDMQRSAFEMLWNRI